MKTFKELDDTRGTTVPTDLVSRVHDRTQNRNRRARIVASALSCMLVALFATTAFALTGSSASGVRTAGSEVGDTETTVATTTTMEEPTTTGAPETTTTTTAPEPVKTIIPGGLDINGDGIVDYPKVDGGYDTNGDGVADYVIIKKGLDVDGDGIADFTCGDGHHWRDPDNNGVNGHGVDDSRHDGRHAKWGGTDEESTTFAPSDDDTRGHDSREFGRSGGRGHHRGGGHR